MNDLFPWLRWSPSCARPFAAYKNPDLETPWHLLSHPDIFLMLGLGIEGQPARKGNKDDR